MSAALPPLPLPDKQSCEDDPMYGIMPVYHYTADQMQAYAQQARADLETENKRLREALESARGAFAGAISKVRENPSLAESTCRHGLHKIDAALKEQP